MLLESPIRLLGALASATDQPARVAAWVELHRWLEAEHSGPRQRMVSPEMTGGYVLSAETMPRGTAVFSILRNDEALRTAVQHATVSLLAGTDLSCFFARTGMPNDRGFMAEAFDRILMHVLPRPKEACDLAQMMRRLYPNEDCIARLQQTPPEHFQAQIELFAPLTNQGLLRPLIRGFADGFRLLAVRAQSHGLAPGLRGLRVDEPVTESPFFQLGSASLALAAAWDCGSHDQAMADAWRMTLARCRVELATTHERMQREGVALDAVFSVELIRRILGRMELMVVIPEAREHTERSAAMRRLLVRMIAFAQHDRSVRSLASSNLRLLHQKVIERAGETGGHYIANSRAEYRHIWFAAAGGGILTTGTAAIKVLVHGVAHVFHLPLLVEGLGYSLNYAASFIVLQHTGLMLATKQPAMTAAALATIVRDVEGDVRHDEIVAVAERICASQVAAAVANVVLVASGCFVFDVLWHLVTGRHWMHVEEASAIYATLSVGDSLTAWYAALTGVILWLSSLAGGTFDNWSARHRIGEGIADLDAPGWVGRDRLARWGAAWRRHCAGWGTNISLGFMLGFTPIFGTILGLPLDVRHVTLNSGILSLAASSLEHDWYRGGFLLWAVAGVATMFILNLSVSFGLSLLTALRAFDLSWGETGDIARRILLRVVTRPHHFLYPHGLPARSTTAHH